MKQNIIKPFWNLVAFKDIIEENDEEEEEEEISQDLPSFKSVIFKGNSAQSLEGKNVFFDAEKGQYVNVDNFAFTDDGNYFEKSQRYILNNCNFLKKEIQYIPE